MACLRSKPEMIAMTAKGMKISFGVVGLLKKELEAEQAMTPEKIQKIKDNFAKHLKPEEIAILAGCSVE